MEKGHEKGIRGSESLLDVLNSQTSEACGHPPEIRRF